MRHLKKGLTFPIASIILPNCIGRTGVAFLGAYVTSKRDGLPPRCLLPWILRSLVCPHQSLSVSSLVCAAEADSARGNESRVWRNDAAIRSYRDDDESKAPGKRKRAARMSSDDDVDDVDYLSRGSCVSSRLGLRGVTTY